MDAHDISEAMKRLWSENVDKNSGSITKKTHGMKVCVWTDQGYREIVGLMYNPHLKCIELEMDIE